jgi:hypothetical protein
LNVDNDVCFSGDSEWVRLGRDKINSPPNFYFSLRLSEIGFSGWCNRGAYYLLLKYSFEFIVNVLSIRIKLFKMLILFSKLIKAQCLKIPEDL